MRSHRGFSLIEMVIMIAIGAVLFTGMGKAFQTLLEMTTENRNYLIALNIAKRQMAIMNNEAFPAVVAETALSADPDYPSFIPTQTVTSVAVSGSYNIRLITIRVRMGSIAGPVRIRLDTYRTDLVTFGNGS